MSPSNSATTPRPMTARRSGRRDGRSVVYELHDAHVAALLRQVLAHVHHGGRA
ncbi:MULTISPECIES: hypothetical protein [unclassified Streptomyces]|uniref:hypothetical protein n=1 Tax=unclassified Streptomyces TaxID=2593676 RepID=UPI001955067A